MRLLIAILLLLVLLLQYKLWFGDGNLRKVWELEARVAEQQRLIGELKERNQALAAEVADLKQGLEAIEERARTEFGMIKKGETFIQVIEE